MSARGKDSWPHLLVADFVWIASRFPSKFEHLEHPAMDLTPWLKLLFEHTRWNEFLSSICRHCDPVCGEIADANVTDTFTSSLPCPTCGAVFANTSALCTHNYRCHGYRNRARYFIVHNTCAACLRKYHHRDDVFRHLAYGNKRCLQLLQRIYSPLPHSTVCELDDAAVTSRKDRAASRCPRTPPCQEHGRLLHVHIVHIRRRLYQFD